VVGRTSPFLLVALPRVAPVDGVVAAVAVAPVAADVDLAAVDDDVIVIAATAALAAVTKADVDMAVVVDIAISPRAPAGRHANTATASARSTAIN
jgi:hypothetical protein